MASGIYKILNRVTGKFYIGSAVNFVRRWKNHKIELRLNRHCNPYLQSAYNKYWLRNFEFIVLEEVVIKSDLVKREQAWLDLTKCYDRTIGYNLCAIAGSREGQKASAETKALLSAKRKGKPRTEAEKAAIKEGWKKRGPVSNETRRKQSLSHIGQLKSDEFKLEMSNRLQGNTFSVGSKRSPEHIASMIAGRKRAANIRDKNLMWEW